MEYRTLEINVVSAKDLKKVNFITKMDVYVVVSIAGDYSTKQKTIVDRDGDDNPTWNFPVKFTIDESAARQNRLTLVFNLRCERTLGDKDVGEVTVPVKELLDATGDDKPVQFVSYQVRKPSGKPKGQLSFSYKFGEKFAGATAPAEKKSDQPITAYPAVAPAVGTSSLYPQVAGPASGGPYPGAYPPPPPVAGYGYPPPPPYGGYPPPPPPPGYGYPPQPGYGYTPQQGYGYPQVQQPPKKNKLGLGLGAGLLGGAIGGLLIGDMVSDAADFDGGCDFDAGF
ncbi:protein SRC2-like [Cornus florida]|uniref:protein SRC2-like n=1 Tax=Cornus florida TaxID=4283 RepID=UPI0028A13358|nr:protein SRC2-like [Cornus florida]